MVALANAVRFFVVFTVVAAPLSAYAEDPTADKPTPPAAVAKETPAEKKAKYALPFAMRPAIAPNLVRIDAAVAMQETASTTSNILTAGGKPVADLGFYVRTGFISLSPDAGDSARAFTNPLLFALYTPEIAPKIRLPIFFGVTAPIGSGGGDDPDKAKRAAVASGIYSRQAMDNALFATNYLTTTAGIGIAWIDKGFTVQTEMQLLQLMRTRGAAVDDDPARTNFTSGVNLGYQIVKYLSANVEVHYQRWLSTPAAVEKVPAARDQATYGAGLRANVPLSDTMIARPGISYFRAFDEPMTTAKFQIVQIDVPIAF